MCTEYVLSFKASIFICILQSIENQPQATATAVLALKILLPRLTGLKPLFSNSSVSDGDQSPSGLIAIAAGLMISVIESGWALEESIAANLQSGSRSGQDPPVRPAPANRGRG